MQHGRRGASAATGPGGPSIELEELEALLQGEDVNEGLNRVIQDIPDNKERLGTLLMMASTFYLRFEMTESALALNFAIACSRKILQLTPTDHPNRCMFLLRTAFLLGERYGKSGNSEDSEEAIPLLRWGLALQPPGDPSQYIHLRTLGSYLMDRYENSGELSDLEEAIACYKKVLSSCPTGHPGRMRALISLGRALYRENMASEPPITDIDEPIEYLKEALQLSHDGPSREIGVANLANALLQKYRTFNKAHDLAELAAGAGPSPHLSPDDPEDSDLEIAIGLLRSSYPPSGSPHNPDLILPILCRALQMRFSMMGTKGDLVEAVKLQRELLLLRPIGHPFRPSRSSALSSSLHTLYRISRGDPQVAGAPFHVDESEALILEAVQDARAPLWHRLQIGTEWLNFRQEKEDFVFRLKLWPHVLDILQQLVAMNCNLKERIDRLSANINFRFFAVNAAADAITAGDLQKAVEMLEYGRGILLSLFHQRRERSDELRKANSKLADKLESIGIELESISGKASDISQDEDRYSNRDRIHNEHTRLLQEWNDTLTSIRKLDTFHDFLLPPTFSKLQSAASEGPVLIAIASIYRCDVIIVRPKGSPVLVPLPNAEIRPLFAMHQEAHEKGHKNVVGMLRVLWNDVVSPVVEALKPLGFRRRPRKPRQRVWWCATSAFSLLPIHAAGSYQVGPDKKTIPGFHDTFISSYTPTLTSLIRARKRPVLNLDEAGPEVDRDLLFIGHRGTSQELVGIGRELEAVQKLEGLAVKTLLEEEASPHACISRMKCHPFVHVACHGNVNHGNPFQSHFQLHAVLTVQEIIDSDLPNAESAVLSACHSASVGFQLMDEGIHLATAMTFAGFKGVVGNMWELPDAEGPILAKEFYEALIALGNSASNAAAALHRVVNVMRETKGPDRWAMLIHVGI